VTPQDAPESVRKQVEAILVRALRECNRLGIDWQDFYDAMLADGRENGRGGGVPAMIGRVFKRLEGRRN
jgi:hypothetical protein